MTDEATPAARALVPGAGKLGMWVFLLTDAVTFAGLLIAYGVLRARAAHWPDPATRLGIPLTAGMTFLLICSSVTMVLALAAARADDRRGVARWLALTILGGLLFLTGQAHEYVALVREKHLGLATDHMASSFFVITGFHGLHVAAGVAYLTVVLARARGGRAGADEVELAGLFWHFVDVVWILVFTFVYLL